MALVFSPRDNLIIESQADLEQSIINNLAIFLDVLGSELIYELKFVYSVTARDGSIQRAGVTQARVKNPRTGAFQVKNFNNKFLVMDVSLSLGGFAKKKLTRLLLGAVNTFAYLPSPDELKIQSAAVKNLVLTGRVPGVEPAAAAAAEPLERGWYVIFSTREGKIQAGPYGSREAAQQFEDARLSDFQRAGRNYNATTLETDNPGLPVFQRIDPGGNTVATAQTPGAASPGVSMPTGKPSAADAATLRQWYEANGETLPPISERAKIYESLGLGFANTYVGSGEQNVELLKALKKQ